MHNLLPNKERLHRIRKAAAPYCVFCPDLRNDDLEHLFNCPKYWNIMSPLMNLMRKLIPEITVSDIITLKLPLEDSTEHPVMWLISTSIMLVWNAKAAGKDLAFSSFKAEVQANLAVLKETRWRYYVLHNSALILEEMLQSQLWSLDRSS